MRRLLASAALLLAASSAWAQPIIRSDENLASDRPEAWAMNYVTGPTLMTSFGQTPALAPWEWQVAGDLGHIPTLSDSDQTVGFLGTKQEDLNRSPVFGRIRAAMGLPGAFVAELGYTPPFTIDGTRPYDLFAAAIGRRFYENGPFTVSARAFGQHGRAKGDITCPARLANAPPAQNPFGCREPSDDRIVMNYYGLDATGAWTSGPWHAHASVGYNWTDLEVQVDALTDDVRDRSLLTARTSWPFLAIGGTRDIDAHWSVGAEILYVPLEVKREIDGATSTDPVTSFRLQLTYRF